MPGGELVLVDGACQDGACIDLVGVDVLVLSRNFLTRLPTPKGSLVPAAAGWSNLLELKADRNRLAPGWGEGGGASCADVINSKSQTDFLSKPESRRDLGLFAEASRLRELSIAYNNLASLPDGLGEGLLNLTRLSAVGNRITRLPNSIGLLRRLRSLSLASNHLKTLPAAITGCRELQELYLDQNELEGLPDALGRLSKLRVLDIRNNPFVVPPLAVVRCRGLKQLLWPFGRVGETRAVEHQHAIFRPLRWRPWLHNLFAAARGSGCQAVLETVLLATNRGVATNKLPWLPCWQRIFSFTSGKDYCRHPPS